MKKVPGPERPRCKECGRVIFKKDTDREPDYCGACSEHIRRGGNDGNPHEALSFETNEALVVLKVASERSRETVDPMFKDLADKVHQKITDALEIFEKRKDASLVITVVGRDYDKNEQSCEHCGERLIGSEIRLCKWCQKSVDKAVTETR